MEETADRSTAFGELDGDERRRLARLGGVLLIVGSVTALPAGLLLDPQPAIYEHAVATIGAITGAIIFRMPWERLSSAWLHVLIVVGTLEVVMGVAVFSDVYGLFYVLVAMYAAYVIRDRAVLAAYLSGITLALLAPLVYADATRELAHLTLVILPVLLLVAAAVRYQRDTLERRELQYRGFAIEAVALAERIRGGEEDVAPVEGDGIARRIKRLRHSRSHEEDRELGG